MHFARFDKPMHRRAKLQNMRHPAEKRKPSMNSMLESDRIFECSIDHWLYPAGQNCFRKRHMI
jgi:hypothetical protein